MGPGGYRTCSPWIFSQTGICSQARYRLHYAAQYVYIVIVGLLLDEATEQLKKQEDLQLESHGKIIEDLTNIQNKSHDALKKLGKHIFNFSHW